MTAFGKTVTAKLGRMRKAQEFTVQPTDDGRIMVQSDRSIGLFDFRTGRGLLNTKGHYFPHLHPAMGAERFEFPAEFVRDCLDACPTLDGATDYQSNGVTLMTVEHTVQMIGASDAEVMS